jgi:RNA polymerase sigma factor (sigma-70 family)
MCGRASPAEPETPSLDPKDILYQAIERDQAVLVRRLTVLVYRVCGRLRHEEVEERVKEVLQEAWRRASEKGASFDPARSATAWVTGFALRILQEQRRGNRRTVLQSDLGDTAWRGALDSLCTVGDADQATIRLDIEQALARLDERQRRAIKLRYFEGLDGEELAHELDAPTAGAARVRLARALQALRAVFGASTDEGSHD